MMVEACNGGGSSLLCCLTCVVITMSACITYICFRSSAATVARSD